MSSISGVQWRLAVPEVETEYVGTKLGDYYTALMCPPKPRSRPARSSFPSTA